MNFHTRKRCSKVIKCCAILYNFLQHERGLADDSEEHDDDDFDQLDPDRPKTQQIMDIFYNDLRQQQQQQLQQQPQ
jgi:hypothetical protein